MKRGSQADWLKELQLALATAVAAVVALGLHAALPPLFGAPIDVEVPASGLTTRPLADDATVPVQLTDPSPAQCAWHLAATLPTFTVITAILAVLLLLVRDARRDDPFTRTAVRRLRLLAVLSLTGLAAGLLEALATIPLADQAADRTAFTWHLTPGWLLLALGFFALAQVFQRGCALRDDLAAVV
ncbi:hypothetical protein GCM10027589_46700 [Actinocorallia lasiicapitis]